MLHRGLKFCFLPEPNIQNRHFKHHGEMISD
jgi:hypothetical protein